MARARAGWQVPRLLGRTRRPTGLQERLAGVAISRVELGDPGSVLGSEVDLHELPDYAGPPEPVGGPPPEWGAAAADTPDPEVTFDPEVPPSLG